MFRTILPAAILAAIAASASLATPPASAQTARAMPDYIVSINKQNSLLGVWTVTTRDGTTTAEYRADGTVVRYVTLGRNPQRAPFFGNYSVQDLGNDRIRLSVTVPMGRQKPQQLVEILRFLPDGSLYSETAGSVAYRLR